MPTDTTTQDITEEIRGLFDTKVGHFAEVRNIIMTGAEALIEQGSREMLIHNIFTVLSERFSQAEVEPVRASLETVSDLTTLNELFRIALHISSVKAFLHTIDTTDK